MKNFYIAITFLCAALLALLVMIACALEPDRPEEPQAIAPEVNAEGLCSVTAVRAPEYEMYFTEADVTALARMLYGEARGCTINNQMKCVWCVLNRVDDVRFPDSIIGVVSAPGQFYGYSPDFPVLDRLYAVALDVLTRWSINTATGLRGFTLPAPAEGTLRVFKKQGIKCDPKQAERVAWRNVRDWVLAQMALVESCDAAVDEVFLPYMTDNSGKTLYQMYSAGRLLPAVH